MAPRQGVCYIIYRATFHANRAHNLTRSPQHISCAQGAYTTLRDIKDGKQMVEFLKSLHPARAQSMEDAPAADGVLPASAVRIRLARELPAASRDAIDLLEKVSHPTCVCAAQTTRACARRFRLCETSVKARSTRRRC